MKLEKSIIKRRSIRKFKHKKVSDKKMKKLLKLAAMAPSGKNRQPWSFLVLQGKSKEKLVGIMQRKLENLIMEGNSTGSLALSLNAISEASAVIIVFNPYSNKEPDYSHYRLLMDMQGIGAAVQTLILAAEKWKLGTLWICDILYCDSEVCEWLGRDDELVAAIAIGYPNQSPNARPRKPIEEVVDWLM